MKIQNSEIKRRNGFLITIFIPFILLCMIASPWPSEAAIRKTEKKTASKKQKVTQTLQPTAKKTKKSTQTVASGARKKTEKNTQKGKKKTTGNQKQLTASSKSAKTKIASTKKKKATKKKTVRKENHRKAMARKKKPAVTPRSISPIVATPPCITTSDPPSGTSEIPFENTLAKYMGTPYRPGGDDLDGMDCSGFASRFFEEVFGIDLPHNSQAISELDILETLSPREHYRPSDLLFFGRSRDRITHLGIYLTNGKFVHAASSGGVTISRLDDAYWRNRLVASKRVMAVDDRLSAFDETNGRFGEPDTGKMSLAEAQLYWDLIPRTLKAGVGTFRQTYGLTANAENLSGSMDHRYDSDTTQWLRGWRAHLNLSPADWLHLTPSVSWIEGSELNAAFDNDAPIYGMEAIFARRDIPWSMGISAHSARFRNLEASDSGLLARNQQTDLSFDLHYQPARTVGVSMGGNSGGASATADQNAVYFRVSVDF